MPSTPLDTLMSYLRRLGPPPASHEDAVLVRGFVAGDENAFALLVRRYAPLVWGVCRRLLPCSQDAEDAFQATFLILLRKAPALGGGPLGPWLHQVACRTATKARARAARQASQETLLTTQPTTEPADEMVWRDLRAVLDEEVGRLPEKFRAPLVLCYLEGLSSEEAAQRLACPPGTIHSRLARGRDRLRARLLRRGIGVPAALFTALLGRASAEAAPAAILDSTLRAGWLRAGAALSPAVLTLAEGVLFSMFAHKLRFLALTLAALALLASGAGLFARRPAATVQTTDRGKAGTVSDKPAATDRKDDKKAEKKAEKPPEPLTDSDLRKALTKTVEFHGVDDPKVTLRDVLDMLSKIHNVQFDINDRAFRAEMLNEPERSEVAATPLMPMKTTLRNVLTKVLSRVPAPSGATFLMRKDRIEITTAEFVRVELGLREDAPADVPLPPVTLETLPPLVQVELTREPLAQALAKVAESTHLNVLIDARVDKKADVPVTASLINVPAETAIRLLADMAGLEVVPVNNVFYVTTPENATRLEKNKQRWGKGVGANRGGPGAAGGA